MIVKAKLNNLRIAPRKVRLVVDLIRGLDIEVARHQLMFLPKRSAGPILKLLNSAAANAKHNFKLDTENMKISEIFVGEGVVLKRIMPRAMGRAAHIRKRTSNVTLILADKNEKADEKKNNKESDKTSVLKKTKAVKDKIIKIEKDEIKAEKMEKAERVRSASAKDFDEAKEKKSEAKAHKGVKRITGMAKRTFKEHNHK